MPDVFDTITEDERDLSDAPLSAFTPGQGDPSMEGGFETFSGAPMHTFEAHLRGETPYVTGATNDPSDIGKQIWRNIGGKKVLVGITDYGPGVKGIDIASENKRWAKNFPFQGQRDKTGDIFDTVSAKTPKQKRDIFDDISTDNPPTPTGS